MAGFDSKSKVIKKGYIPQETALSFTSGFTDWRIIVRQHFWAPPTDVYEDDDHYLVLIEIAGANEDDISVITGQNKLSVSGIRTNPFEPQGFRQMEINFGEFSTEIEFPNPVDIDRVEAQYKNGFLSISLPKAQARHIMIEDYSEE